MMAEESQVRLRLTSSDGSLDAAELESMAIQLRQDLLDAGVSRVERESAGPAPAGARSVELVTAGIGFLVTGLSTVGSAAQIVDFVQRWRQAHPRRDRLAISVTGADATSPAPRSGRRSALLVANAGYADPALSRLRSPIQDTRALAGVLGEPRIGGFDVDQLVDADEPTIRRRVAAFFADRHPDDVLALHFSCHGVKDHRGRLYLTAADTQLRSLAATALPASFVAEQMSDCVSRRILLILDCCYSGAFARGTSVRSDRTVQIAEEFGGSTGRIVLTASSATEYSFEGEQPTAHEARPSVFTQALVAGLRSGAADLNGDGEISADELYEYAYRVVRDARTGQEPRKWTFGMAGALVVARSTRLAVLPAEIRADLASGRVVLRLAAVAALASLVAGNEPGLRDAARAALAGLREHDDSIRVRMAAAAALGESATPPAAPLPRSEPTAATMWPSAPSPHAVVAPADTPARSSATTESPTDATPGPSGVAPRVRVVAPTAAAAVDGRAAPPAVPATSSDPGPSPRATPDVNRRRRRIIYAALTSVLVLTTAAVWIVVQQVNRDGERQVPFGGALSHGILGDSAAVTDVGLSPDGRTAVTVGKEPGGSLASERLHLWDAATGQSTGTLVTDGSWVFSPDGKTIATVNYTGKREISTADQQTITSIGAGDTQVRLWDIATGKATATLTGHKGSACVAFSPDSRTVATASTLVADKESFNNPVRLWDPASGTLYTTLTGHTNGVQSMDFSSGGTTLATGSVDGTARVWNRSTGRSSATLTGKDSYVYWVMFSPDGKILATRGGDDPVRLWSVRTGRIAVTLPTSAQAVFSPDGRRLVTFGADRTARLWDTVTGRNTATLTGHTDTVTKAVFSPDGRALATAGADRTVRLWDTSTDQTIATLAGHADGVTDIVFSPDGRTLLSAGKDRTVWRWNVAR